MLPPTQPLQLHPEKIEYGTALRKEMSRSDAIGKLMEQNN
jgi:hypothetical protein